ncbi:MAG: holo-ACP synthase [Elusimicrobiota bacterium]|nr:holo-ACP synthase [Elusimicrobiota bacterium]
MERETGVAHTVRAPPCLTLRAYASVGFRRVSLIHPPVIRSGRKDLIMNSRSKKSLKRKTQAPGITGLGVDLVEVSRIRKMAERNPGFLKRFFTPGELAYSSESKNKYERLAARFAVKEAVIKALDAKDLPLKSIEVESTASGRPQVRVKSRPLTRLMVSISHTGTHAVAAVIAFA